MGLPQAGLFGELALSRLWRGERAPDIWNSSTGGRMGYVRTRTTVGDNPFGGDWHFLSRLVVWCGTASAKSTGWTDGGPWLGIICSITAHLTDGLTGRQLLSSWHVCAL
jgi:hypothetical protein